MLSNSPAQTCLAVASSYNYGRQGLPDLPTRLGPRQLRSDTKSTRNTSSNGTSEPYPSSPHHPLPCNEDGPRPKTGHHITTTLSQSNMSNASDNAASFTGTQGQEANGVDKTIILIKKKSSTCIKHNLRTRRLMDSEKMEDKLSASEVTTSTCSVDGVRKKYIGDETVDEESTKEDIASEGNKQKSPASLNKTRCSTLPLLKQRLGYIWENRKFTDVVFLVGRSRRKIEAHRMILASCSELFESLLYNDQESVVPLRNEDEKYLLYENDFSEEALEVFIKAMYTNEIPICVTLDIALEIFYATKKYAVVFLEHQILDHIKDILTVANVFEALQISTNTVELSYLAPVCWKIIEDQTADVLTYYLDTLETRWFVRILERDRLSLEEVELFQFAVRWAAHKCKAAGQKTTGKNKRTYMEPLIRHLRFTTMSPTQFNDVVIPARILDPKEIQQIQHALCKMLDSKHVGLPYKSTPRVNTASVEITSRSGSQRRYSSSNFVHANILDGRGDVGQQQNPVQSINSDPGLSVGSRISGSSLNKKGASSTKPKTKRSLVHKKIL